MAQADRFANVFTSQVVMSSNNQITWVEMNFGISLRDRIAIVIDEIYFYWRTSAIAEMTATGDFLQAALASSDQITSITANERRIYALEQLVRLDLGTAAGGVMVRTPAKQSFAPPLIVLPNRLFLGANTGGLASAMTLDVRMHYRTVPITAERQLLEVLETFQLST